MKKPPRTSSDAGAHLGLHRWVSREGSGSLLHADVGRYRIAAGEPRSAPSRLPGLFREFEDGCARAKKRALYFGLSETALKALDPAGKRGRWHIGDLPVFFLDRWADPAGIPPSIRSQARRARKQGVTVRRLDAPPADPGPLRACLRSWITDKALPPLSFVTTPFLFDPWPDQGVFVAERNGAVAGFLTASLELLPDLWRVDAVGRAKHAPNGCAELLVSEAFRYASEQCYQRATLGLAPLSRRSGGRVPHWMDRVQEVVREAGVPGYSFAGLEAFKAKFQPEEWRPLYCVSGGGRLSVRDVLAVIRAFAGGSLARYGFRSVLWMLGRRRLPQVG